MTDALGMYLLSRGIRSVMSEGRRPAWERPELIVLVRTRPEEAVLLACKNATATTAQAPIEKWGGCNNRRTQVCTLCQQSGSS